MKWWKDHQEIEDSLWWGLWVACAWFWWKLLFHAEVLPLLLSTCLELSNKLPACPGLFQFINWFFAYQCLMKNWATKYNLILSFFDFLNIHNPIHERLFKPHFLGENKYCLYLPSPLTCRKLYFFIFFTQGFIRNSKNK